MIAMINSATELQGTADESDTDRVDVGYNVYGKSGNEHA
jgi:hypothetical protein